MHGAVGEILPVCTHTSTMALSLPFRSFPPTDCNGYDYPNATHIQIPPSGMAYEGIPFSLRCLYNGDTDSNEYMLAWNKDDLKDITIGSIGKYLESADSDCNAGEPCCSFSDHLTVFNVSIKDSGLYSCVASSEAGGDAPFGASKSAYIGEPQVFLSPN